MSCASLRAVCGLSFTPFTIEYQSCAAAGLLLVVPAGPDELFHGIHIVDRHHRTAHFIRGRMQRDRKRQAKMPFGQL